MSCPELHSEGVECVRCTNGYLSDGDIVENIISILTDSPADYSDGELLDLIVAEIEKTGVPINFQS